MPQKWVLVGGIFAPMPNGGQGSGGGRFRRSGKVNQRQVIESERKKLFKICTKR